MSLLMNSVSWPVQLILGLLFLIGLLFILPKR